MVVFVLRLERRREVKRCVDWSQWWTARKGNVSEQLEREAGRLHMLPLKVLTFEKDSVGLLWWPDLWSRTGQLRQEDWPKLQTGLGYIVRPCLYLQNAEITAMCHRFWLEWCWGWNPGLYACMHALLALYQLSYVSSLDFFFFFVNSVRWGSPSFCL